jgi:S1-C subfamily serine protease
VVTGGDERWGLSVEPLGSDLSRRLASSQGVVVTDVTAGGPADKAGLRRGDIILSVKGHAVADAEALYLQLDALKPGDSVPLYVRRPGGSGRNEYVVLERPGPP